MIQIVRMVQQVLKSIGRTYSRLDTLGTVTTNDATGTVGTDIIIFGIVVADILCKRTN